MNPITRRKFAHTVMAVAALSRTRGLATDSEEKKPLVDWFEIISENYMDSQGRPRHVLERIASPKAPLGERERERNACAVH